LARVTEDLFAGAPMPEAQLALPAVTYHEFAVGAERYEDAIVTAAFQNARLLSACRVPDDNAAVVTRCRQEFTAWVPGEVTDPGVRAQGRGQGFPVACVDDVHGAVLRRGHRQLLAAGVECKDVGLGADLRQQLGALLCSGQVVLKDRAVDLGNSQMLV